MSREIKFRAWSSEDKEFICDWDTGNPSDLTFCNDGTVTVYEKTLGCHCSPEGCGGCADEYRRHTDVVIMQYTSLHDCNGVEIYEGDLLRIPANDKYEEETYNCFEVFYHDNECIGGLNIGFCINRMHPQGNSAGGRGYKFTPESIKQNGLVVIGNIHENPELLTGLQDGQN